MVFVLLSVTMWPPWEMLVGPCEVLIVPSGWSEGCERVSGMYEGVSKDCYREERNIRSKELVC